MDDRWLKQLKEHPDEEQALVTGHINMILTWDFCL